MPKELLPEEKKAEAEAQDALIKHVFDNLRNVIICVTLVLAGGAVIKYRAVLPLGSTFNTVIGVLVILSAGGLFGWNMVHGVEKVIRPVKGTRKSWPLVLFASVYMFCVLTVFQALVRTQAEQQFRTTADKHVPHNVVEKGTPQAGVSPHTDRTSP
jgi:hypothetical protein